MYPPTAERLASPRRQSGQRDIPGPTSFLEDVALLARRLRLSVPDLNDRERELLHDFARAAGDDAEVRYRLVTVRAFCAIAGRSTRPEDREQLPELIRAEILRDSSEQVDVAAAFDVETSVTGPADVAQRQFERDPNPTTWRRCVDTLRQQLTATHQALCSVLQRRSA